MNSNRRLESKRVRDEATNTAFNRTHPVHKANGDEQRYAAANYAMSFTKGLDHDEATGLIKSKAHFEIFRQSIDNGVIDPFTTRVPVPQSEELGRRKWEAPTAGVVHDLEGPDAQAVTMAPAPPLCSDELTFEMAEVYELALLRDVAFRFFDKDGGSNAAKITAAVGRLNSLEYAQKGFPERPRKTDDSGALDLQTVFRGSSPGVEVGPYLSQFLLVGNTDQTGQIVPTDGRITYGAQTVDQRVPFAIVKDDYMVSRADWLEVQQGFNVNAGNNSMSGQQFSKDRRFIHRPRDLATYVHFDALYQAYLNACLIMLRTGTPFDPGFANLSGQPNPEVLLNAGDGSTIRSNTGGFALYGGPHILTLVTEVATRALKAVRYQKFNNHLRLRPEALAARLEYAEEIEEAYPEVCGAFSKTAEALSDTLDEIRDHNKNLPKRSADTVMLPMAFAEGSPMHPSYGAGHATVAGACVTILKAFFDTSAVFATIEDADGRDIAGFYGSDTIAEARANNLKVEYVAYESANSGKELDFQTLDCPLTLEGELNKLCANISIGRNMAGVHYFSDYYDSARMGEEIAIGILEEQALCYPLDPFVLSVPTFDGDLVRIGRR